MKKQSVIAFALLVFSMVVLSSCTTEQNSDLSGEAYASSGAGTVTTTSSSGQTTYVIQPGPSDGNDVWIEGTSNKNSYSFLIVGKAKNYPKKRTVLQFPDLSFIPGDANILNAVVEVYHYGYGCTGDSRIARTVQLHEVLANWSESHATSVRRLNGVNWNQQYVGLNNIDAKNTPESKLNWTVNNFGWKSYDVTSLVKKWAADKSKNKGVLLWAINENTDGCDMRSYSSEYTTSSLRPKLTVVIQQTNSTNQTNQTQYGNLFVNTTNANPANIFVDDVYKGLTPNMLDGVTAGTHTVKVNKTGYIQNISNVNIITGSTTSLYVTLNPFGGSSGNGTTNQTNTTGNQSQIGNLYVKSTPSDANLYVDSTSRGYTPITVANLAVGSHNVLVKFPGYSDFTGSVSINSGATTNLTVTLQQINQTNSTGNLYVNSTPASANIFLDGIYKGLTPKTFDGVNVGTYTVKVNKTDYYDWQQAVTIYAGQTTKITALLEPR